MGQNIKMGLKEMMWEGSDWLVRTEGGGAVGGLL
jgi:hypothetical protein